MAITKKDLQIEVDELNKKYCKNSKHELRVSGAYGGYKVEITGKPRADGKGYRGYLGSGAENITNGYMPAKETLAALHKADAKGNVKYAVSRFDKKKSR